jgi:hypothetical protein
MERSTTWEWRRVKIERPAGGQVAAPKASARPSPLRKPKTLTVKFRGGDEAWWEIRCGDRTIRRPGVTALHDVLKDVYGLF